MGYGFTYLRPSVDDPKRSLRTGNRSFKNVFEKSQCSEFASDVRELK